MRAGRTIPKTAPKPDPTQDQCWNLVRADQHWVKDLLRMGMDKVAESFVMKKTGCNRDAAKKTVEHLRKIKL